MEKTVSTGEVIIRRGEISPSLFVIKIGKVMVESENRVYYLSGEDFFGEEGVLLKKPSRYTAVASDETVLEVFNVEEIEIFLNKNNDTNIRMMKKSIALAYDKCDNFSESSSIYLKLLEELLIFAKGKSGPGKHKLDTSLLHLAEKLKISTPSLRVLLLEADKFGAVYLSPDSEIYTVSEDNLRKKINSSYLRNFFIIGDDKAVGRGKFNLLNDLKDS